MLNATYTVKLVGVDSEGKPLTQVWCTGRDMLKAIESVTQIMVHKSEADRMHQSDQYLFNGNIEIVEEIQP